MNNENAIGQTDKSLTDIDAALAVAAANARKARKAAGTDGTPAETVPKRQVKTPEERQTALAKLEQERADRKEAKEKARKEKQDAAQASRPPAHMKKVERAAEKLGALGETAQLLFAEATTNLSAAEITALALHLQHFNRVQATTSALVQELKVGEEIRIVGGQDTRFIGKEGTLIKVNKIRCYVRFEGQEKLGYFYTSDVQVIAATEVPEGSTGAASEPEAPAGAAEQATPAAA